MNLKDISRIADSACSEFGVKRLDVFGSLARGEFTDSSDIDLLVEFGEPERTPAKRFFGLLHYMEDKLGCTVDLLTATGLRNPYFRKRVEQEKVTIYEGCSQYGC